MLAVELRLLQAIDAVGLLLGAAVGVGVLARWHRRGDLRNPLARVAAPTAGPTLSTVLAILLLYVALAYGLLQALGMPEPATASAPAATPAPGSDAWHRAIAADIAAKLIVSAVMLGLLAGIRRAASAAPTLNGALAVASPVRPRRIGGGVATLRIGLIAALVITPACMLQLEMGRHLWKLMQPESAQPVHVVLQAVRSSAWGGLGLGQLLLSALFVAPLVEELFFRGVLLGCVWAATRRAWLASLVSALAFGAVHAAQPQDVLPLVTMGLALAVVRLRYDALGACVLVHLLFNARTMALALLAPELIDAPP